MRSSSRLADVVAMARERVLRLLTARKGMSRVVNGLPFRVASPVRALFTEDYDRRVADFLRSHISPGSEVWNVGANVGIYALQLASWVGPSGRVVAFEPNPEAAKFLRENLRLNDLQDRVEVIEAAVGEECGSVDFYVAGANGMARAGAPNPLLPETTVVRATVTTLDAFRSRRTQAPSWIMMDIEGWEIAALRGASTLLTSTRVAVELHPSAWAWSGHSRHDLEDLLNDWKLAAHPLAGQHDVLSQHGQVVLESLDLPR